MGIFFYFSVLRAINGNFLCISLCTKDYLWEFSFISVCTKDYQWEFSLYFSVY
jgi:hypothetical protein